MSGDAATRAYLRAARLAAKVLGRSEIVESVWVRRSVAAGEVSFGRSDIDLGLAIRPEAARDGEGAALLALYRRFRALRVALPILGECQVYDDLDLRTWWSTDTFRASIDRRSAITLHGAPVEVPDLPIPPGHAARRCAFWLDGYLPTAYRSGNMRNLRKFAVEMWNASATARGLLREPLVRRSEAEQLWRDMTPAQAARLRGGRDELLALCFGLLSELHAALQQPLRPLQQTYVLETALPPNGERRTMVVLPSSETAPPREAELPRAMLFTPEALHLYLEYVNPFAACALGGELMDSIGLAQPGRAAAVRACRNYGASFRTRSPGFEERRAAAAEARVRWVARTLGQDQPAAAPEEVSTTRYYRDIYARVRAECARFWPELERLSGTS